MTKLNRLEMILIGCAFAFLILFAGTFYHYNSVVERLETDIDKANEVLANVDETNQKELDKYKAQMEQVVSEYEVIVDELEKTNLELEEYKKYINLDEYKKEVLDKAKEISMETPLDFDASLMVVKYSEKFELNPSFLLSVIDLESNFKSHEVGAARDRGFMQIIPATERWLIKDFGQELGFKYDPSRIFEAEYNIGLGAAYLGLLKGSYGDNYDRILSEYNRGPSNLKRYYLEHQTYETAYSRVILNKEYKYLSLN